MIQMTNTCKFCFKTISVHKPSLYRHQKICKKNPDVISKDDLENAFKCKFCSKPITHKTNLYRHQLTCKENPDSPRFISNDNGENNTIEKKEDVNEKGKEDEKEKGKEDEKDKEKIDNLSKHIPEEHTSMNSGNKVQPPIYFFKYTDYDTVLVQGVPKQPYYNLLDELVVSGKCENFMDAVTFIKSRNKHKGNNMEKVNLKALVDIFSDVYMQGNNPDGWAFSCIDLSVHAFALKKNDGTTEYDGDGAKMFKIFQNAYKTALNRIGAIVTDPILRNGETMEEWHARCEEMLSRFPLREIDGKKKDVYNIQLEDFMKELVKRIQSKCKKAVTDSLYGHGLLKV
jgi:hypothetical protein